MNAIRDDFNPKFVYFAPTSTDFQPLVDVGGHVAGGVGEVDKLGIEVVEVGVHV